MNCSSILHTTTTSTTTILETCIQMQRNFATFQPNRLNCLSVLTIIMKNTEQTKCKMKQIIEINEDCGIDCSRVQTHNVIVFFSRLVHNLVALVPTACSYVQAHTQVFQFAIDDVSNNEMVSKTCEREETKNTPTKKNENMLDRQFNDKRVSDRNWIK